MDIIQKMQEEADDAAEFKKTPQNLSARIAHFLDGRPMSASEAGTLTREHGPQIDAEIERRATVAARKKAEDEKNALRIFADGFTQQELEDGKKAIREFAKPLPIFQGDSGPTNLQILLEEVEKRKLFVTKENLKAVYADLRSQGFFATLTEPAQSAEEYKKEHISHWGPPQVPAFVLQSISKILSTFAANHPQYVQSPRNEAVLTRAIRDSGAPISSQLLESVYQVAVSGESWN